MNAALKLARKIIEDGDMKYPAHRYMGVRGGLLLFRRERPSYCRLCDRIHHKDNTLMITIKDGVITEHCRRVKEGRILGKVEVKEVNYEKQIKSMIRRKLAYYKRRDLLTKRTFDLDVDHILELKNALDTSAKGYKAIQHRLD